MTPEIDIDILIEDPRWQDAIPEHENIVHKCADNTIFLKGEVIELSVVLTNDAHITKLNKEYRNKNKPTNVISFPLQNWEEPDEIPILSLGDVIVSLDTIEIEAKEQSKSLQDHFTHLLVHGVLHLLGHDHEIEEEAVIMESLEIKILNGMGIKNPYEDN